MARASCEASLYVGIEGIFVSVLPKIFWTNPLSQWIKQSLIFFEDKESAFYEVNNVSNPAAKVINLWFEENPPEKLLLNKRVHNFGFGLFFGVSKELKQKFYIGAEGKIKYKFLELIENAKDEVLLDCSDGAIFLKTGLTGKVPYSTKIDCYKKLETDLAIRFGYAPVKDVLGYVKLGVSLSQLMINQMQIDLQKGDFATKRLDDTKKKDDTIEAIVPPFPSGQYCSSERRLYFPSLILGVGVEKFFGKNFFIRLEYEFQTAIATKMHALSDEGIGKKFEKSSIEYALRYQDTEHQIAVGIGRNF